MATWTTQARFDALPVEGSISLPPRRGYRGRARRSPSSRHRRLWRVNCRVGTRGQSRAAPRRSRYCEAGSVPAAPVAPSSATTTTTQYGRQAPLADRKAVRAVPSTHSSLLPSPAPALATRPSRQSRAHFPTPFQMCASDRRRSRRPEHSTAPAGPCDPLAYQGRPDHVLARIRHSW